MRAERPSQTAVNCGKPFGKKNQISPLGGVAGQFVRGLGRWTTEFLGIGSDEAAQPDVTEVHQFSILDVSEIRRVGEHGIETSRSEFDLHGAPTTNGDNTPATVTLLAYAFVRDWNPDVSRAAPLDLERSIAVAFRFDVFVDDIGPPAGTDVRAVSVHDSEKVRFTLDQTDRESVYGEDVQRFEGCGVVPAEHVLIAQEIRKIRCECVAYARVLDRGDESATQFQPQ